jgi:hypothetical protein
MYRVIQVLLRARLTLLKNYETLGLHSLHVRLQTQSIFPYHFIQSHKINKIDFDQKKNNFPCTLKITINSKNIFMKFASKEKD